MTTAITASRPFIEFERDPDAETGVMWDDFVSAIGIWVYTNEDGRRVTIADAALAFNTTVDLVREAVREHPWLFAPEDPDPTKQIIQSDGE